MRSRAVARGQKSPTEREAHHAGQRDQRFTEGEASREQGSAARSRVITTPSAGAVTTREACASRVSPVEHWCRAFLGSRGAHALAAQFGIEGIARSGRSPSQLQRSPHRETASSAGHCSEAATTCGAHCFSFANEDLVHRAIDRSMKCGRTTGLDDEPRIFPISPKGTNSRPRTTAIAITHHGQRTPPKPRPKVTLLQTLNANSRATRATASET